MKKKISIIVPIYNREKNIKKCIISLVEQTYKNIEIILINDGSSDNSENICLNLSKTDNRIKYYKQKNSGVSSARNYGLKVATGDYITFVDSDDYLKNDFVDVMLEKIEKNNCDMVACNITRVNENGEVLYNINNNSGIYDYSSALKLFFINQFPISSCAKLFKRKIIDNIFFDTTITNNEDKLFIFECLKKINNCEIIDYAGYYYLDNANSASKKINLKIIKNILYVSDIINNYSIKEYPEYKNISAALCRLEICRTIIVNKDKNIPKKVLKEIIKDYKIKDFNLGLINNKKRKLELYLLKKSYILYLIFIKFYLSFKKGI